MKSNIFIYLLISIGLCITGCTSESTSGGTDYTNNEKGQSAVQDDESNNNILQIAINSADHSTLVAAVQAAELENVLVNAGPLTVFAPTNAAFNALPEGTVENLLKPENKETLSTIIKYHASPGKYTVDLLKDGMQMFMATGHYVKVEVNGDEIRIGGAKILGTVEASNGVVHVIDKVLLPPEAQ